MEKCDPGLFRVAAERLNEIDGSLILIGAEADWASELSSKLGNVHWLGPKKAKEVPAYLQHADVGLMLYDRKRSDVYKGQNPLKLYEYAAAGLSILSTPHTEFEYLNPPVLEVSHESEVADALDRAIEQRTEGKQESLRFAAKHSWASIYQKAREQIRF